MVPETNDGDAYSLFNVQTECHQDYKDVLIYQWLHWVLYLIC